MKQQSLKNSTSVLACLMISAIMWLPGKAQMNTDHNYAYGGKQKISVDLKITPSTKAFSVAVVTTDSFNTKLRLWVCNGEERRCTVSIGNETGSFWNMRFKDAYYNQVYDLSLLDDGDYKMVIDNGKESIERKFTIRSSNYVKREVMME